MEQIDLSTLAGDMFNMLVPESVSSKVSSLRMKLPRKTASSNNLKNAPNPPPPSRRRSASTSISTAASNTKSSSRTYAESFLGVKSSAEPLISKAESNATTLYSSSSTSSSTRTSVSSRGSLTNLDYSRQQFHQQQQLQQLQQLQQSQQLQQYFPPPPQYQHYPQQQQQQQQYCAPLAPVLEEQQWKLMQQASKQMATPREERLAARGTPMKVAGRLQKSSGDMHAKVSQHLTAMASEELDDPTFERRSYIDGVAYYLRACPDNLNDLETDILLRSAPWLAERPQLRGGSQSGGSTFLHRTVRQAVALAMVALHSVWCALLMMGRVGVRYERQYNLSSQFVSHGYWFANNVGKHSVHLSARLQKAGDGKVGQIVSGLAAWTMESFTGGIQDGYGDGIVRIRGQAGAEGGKVAIEQEYFDE
ncbi:hypothetical protein PG994_000079 [Apiospora phragmitis]|uniref:Uncharacterized protein n=1 Tax=Apiospora phragmitis TaxID=2905665 RepID=A0ABR1X5F0_9PEZI